METNAAIIKIDAKTLLKILDFEGGTIHRAYMPKELWQPKEVWITLEHPDLPEVSRGDILIRIVPIYATTYGDNGGIIKVERVDPPKKET